MGRSLDMLKRVDCSKLPIAQAPTSYGSNSQARELRNKQNHIVMYSSGPLHLGAKCKWQLIRIALILVASWLCCCMYATK